MALSVLTWGKIEGLLILFPWASCPRRSWCSWLHADTVRGGWWHRSSPLGAEGVGLKVEPIKPQRRSDCEEVMGLHQKVPDPLHCVIALTNNITLHTVFIQWLESDPGICVAGFYTVCKCSRLLKIHLPSKNDATQCLLMDNCLWNHPLICARQRQETFED